MSWCSYRRMCDDVGRWTEQTYKSTVSLKPKVKLKVVHAAIQLAA